MSTLIFLSRPEYSVVIDFSISVGVTLATSDDFSILIDEAIVAETTLSYGGAEADVGSVTTLGQETLRPAARASGAIASLPRLE